MWETSTNVDLLFFKSSSPPLMYHIKMESVAFTFITPTSFSYASSNIIIIVIISAIILISRVALTLYSLHWA